MPFLNVENGGKWLPGGTYTFDYQGNREDGDGGGFYWIVGWTVVVSGDHYYVTTTPGSSGYAVNSVGSGLILFDNNDVVTATDDPGTEFTGGVGGVTVDSLVDLGEGVWRYTVTIDASVPSSTYYLKGAYEDLIGLIG